MFPAAVPNLSQSHLHDLGEAPTLLSLLFLVPSLLSKDTAQGCNKIHTKVIFTKKKTKQKKKLKTKLLYNCSSNAQQATNSWLPDTGSPGDVQLGLGCCHCSEGEPLPAVSCIGLVFYFFLWCAGLLFKSPHLYVLHIEILFLREHRVPKCFTGVTPSVVQVSVQPQAKLTTAREKTRHILQRFKLEHITFIMVWFWLG